MSAIFLDYDGVVNTLQWSNNTLDNYNKNRPSYNHENDNVVNNFQAVQWISKLCYEFHLDIVCTSTWRRSDNYAMCLRNAGLWSWDRNINIDRVSTHDYDYRNNIDKTREQLINDYLKEHTMDLFIVIDDEDVFIENPELNDLYFVKCTRSNGFGLEEYEEAARKLRKQIELA